MSNTLSQLYTCIVFALLLSMLSVPNITSENVTDDTDFSFRPKYVCVPIATLFWSLLDKRDNFAVRFVNSTSSEFLMQV